MKKVLKLPALKIKQGEGKEVISFAVDGKIIHNFAAISRLGRNDTNELKGYQRPEISNHIMEIRNYLETEHPMIPNALVLAFDKRVKFTPTLKVSKKESKDPIPGTIKIPIDDCWSDKDKPGFIVDGQQRSAAIRDARVEHFPIFVSAFITGNDDEQREQFILVNSTRPLPKSLIYEMLPMTTELLSSQFQKKKFPARLMNRMNNDPESPFHGIIKTTTNPTGVVQDNSILKMLENSLNDGILFNHSIHAEGEDIDTLENDMAKSLYRFWGSVKTCWPEAWGLQPRKSRLMHGVGIVSMGHVMDYVCDEEKDVGLSEKLSRINISLSSICKWTSGYWTFSDGDQKWNSLQNTHPHIKMLTALLLRHCKNIVETR